MNLSGINLLDALDHKGKACGSIGAFGTYSFFPSKNLGGLGDAGAVVCQDDAWAARLRALRNHGMEPRYHHHLVGGNFRIDALQAALLAVKLPHYGEYTRVHQANAAHYTTRLRELPGVVTADPAHCRCAERQSEALAEAGARLVLPVAYPHNEHIWNQYTLRVLGEGRRDALKDFLASRGIGCEIYYPVTMDRQACFAGLPEASRRGCAVAHRLASEVLSIPVYPELGEGRRDEVVDAIADFLQA